MTEQTQMPLIGPLRRRGWREIMYFRPLSNISYVALVVTRQGRLAGVIPANDRRVLSDYLTWPYDFREVDMRERLLLVHRPVESCDAGYEFDATLKLTYQVEQPERVALELEDALAELEGALAQSMRATSRSFGVEQATALEENLREALLYGDVLRERLEALGLGLRRADVAVELDERARERAEALRQHMRERPLLARLAIESLEPAISFDVLLGGGYRLTSRTLTIVAQEAHDAALQDAIARTLGRVGIAFAPHDYAAAGQAMAEALRQDALLQSELSAAEIELVRPTVRIQPDRQMIVAAQNAAPAPSADRTWRGPALLGGPAGMADQPADAPSWVALGAMFGREAPRALPAPADISAPPSVAQARINTEDQLASESRDQLAIEVEIYDPKAGGQLYENTATLDQGDEESLGWLAPLAEDQAHATAELEAPQRAIFSDAKPQAEPIAIEQPVTPASDTLPMLPKEAPIDSQSISRWIALLQADDPALFKLWSMELIARPMALPTILAALTDDQAMLDRSDDPRYQRAMVEALAGRQEVAPGMSEAKSLQDRLEQEQEPDWLSLRRIGHEEVRDE
jgi:hypothetical protein